MRIRFFSVMMMVIACSANYAQSAASDERQIRELIDRLTSMWTAPDGVAVAREVTADNVLFVTDQGSLSREEYLGILPAFFQYNQAVSTRHDIVKIRISGNTAYEYGRGIWKMKDGSEQRMELLNILVKEKGVWRYFGALPADLVRSLVGD